MKREERYFPPFELVRRLAKPPDSGWRQMIRGIASIIVTCYIIPPIMLGSIAGAAGAGSGLLATTASVVKIRLATEAAF